jgi:hypothetical protein
MSDFVEQCRREWRRLGVPDPLAEEMAADLASDLSEAEADGVSAEELLGSSAFDPRSFAASWAAERGIIPAAPSPGKARRRPLVRESPLERHMAQGNGDKPEGLTFRGVPRALWRWKWVVLAVAACATLAAYGLALRETPMYRATVALLYQPPNAPDYQFINPTSQPSPQAAPAAALYSGAAGIVSKPAVVARAERILGGTPRLPYRVSAELVGGAATAPYNGQVVNQLKLSATSPGATESADVANAYARAVCEWSKAPQLARIALAEQSAKDRLKAFSSPQSRRLPEYFALKVRLQELAVAKLAATGDYRVLVPASAPTAPYAPHPKNAAAVGLLGGLVGGIVLALVLGRLGPPRLRGRRHLSDSSGTLGSSVTP